ncbi:hypothetical protein STEG23_005370, partial [Scotinomys teguina]
KGLVQRQFKEEAGFKFLSPVVTFHPVSSLDIGTTPNFTFLSVLLPQTGEYPTLSSVKEGRGQDPTVF